MCIERAEGLKAGCEHEFNFRKQAWHFSMRLEQGEWQNEYISKAAMPCSLIQKYKWRALFCTPCSTRNKSRIKNRSERVLERALPSAASGMTSLPEERKPPVHSPIGIRAAKPAARAGR
jgi:hypothetical protein